MVKVHERRRVEEILCDVVSSTLHGELTRFEPLAGGYVGKVYRVTVERGIAEQDVVVKLTQSQWEVPLDAEDVNDRVYGSRSSNFEPAYQLLKKHRIPVPKFFGSGVLEHDRVHYLVLEFLEGVDVRSSLAHGQGNFTGLHEAVGTMLGKMHRITRPYHGWLAMKKSSALDWESAFFTSLRSRLETASKHSKEIKARYRSIASFIEDNRKHWTQPKRFVFSHTDGFQGMAKRADKRWAITGIIDIEDHQFTDQRFVLAGHELSLEYEGRTLPKVFWDAYQKQTSVDPSFHKLKNVFKLYYLLTWIDSWVNGDGKGRTRERVAVEKRLEHMITMTF